VCPLLEIVSEARRRFGRLHASQTTETRISSIVTQNAQFSYLKSTANSHIYHNPHADGLVKPFQLAYHGLFNGALPTNSGGGSAKQSHDENSI
jgi:hypothetical protein